MTVPQRPLVLLVAAESLSSFGSQLSALAIPWFVLVSTGSAARMGLVFAVELLPLAILGIPSGGVIDRFGARNTMRVCDAARAPILALVPALHYASALSFPLLLLLVAINGVFATPYFAAQRLAIPEVVGREETAVARGNAIVEGATNAASFAGPAVAGALIAATSAPTAIAVDAATFVVSFALISAAVPRRRESAVARARTRVRDGIRYIKHDPLVARVAVSSIMFGFAFRLLFVSFPLLAFYRYDRDARVAGLLSAAWGLGAIVGSVVAYRVVSLRDPLRLAGVAALGTALPLWLLVPDLGLVFVAAAVSVSSAAIPTINAPYLALLSTRVPTDLQGRVFQSILTINNLAGPLAYLVGAAMIGAVGLTWNYAAIATVATVAGINFLLTVGEGTMHAR